MSGKVISLGYDVMSMYTLQQHRLFCCGLFESHQFHLFLGKNGSEQWR